MAVQLHLGSAGSPADSSIRPGWLVAHRGWRLGPSARAGHRSAESSTAQHLAESRGWQQRLHWPAAAALSAAAAEPCLPAHSPLAVPLLAARASFPRGALMDKSQPLRLMGPGGSTDKPSIVPGSLVMVLAAAEHGGTRGTSGEGLAQLSTLLVSGRPGTVRAEGHERWAARGGCCAGLPVMRGKALSAVSGVLEFLREQGEPTLDLAPLCHWHIPFASEAHLPALPVTVCRSCSATVRRLPSDA